MTGASHARWIGTWRGGVLGAAWSVGALNAIESLNGIDLGDCEVIVGTSAGSVLAGLLGPGSDRLVSQSLVSGRRRATVDGVGG
jgi:predicted acylesterase/phospholipase RssA